MIKLIGMGLKSVEELNKEIKKYIKNNDVVYATEGLLEIEELKGKEIKIFNSEVNGEELENKENIIFLAQGNIILDYSFSKKLLKDIKLKKLDFHIVRGESYLNIANENIDSDIKVIEATAITNITKNNDYFIHNIGSIENIKKMSDYLLNYIGDIEIKYFQNLKEGLYEKEININISELKKISTIGINDGVYIPKTKRDFNDLLDIVKILRGPNGCPWDKEQNHKTLKRELVEECYEVLDAIDKEDNEAIAEETGDVMLHVVFHGLIGEEENAFDIYDISEGICEKMIFRHPHIFNNEDVENSSEVIKNWENLKREEKGFKSISDEIAGIAKGLPALIRAKKVQKKAAKVGFDFPNIDEAIKSLESEIKEFKDVYKSKNMIRIEDELGDVFFSTVNIGRLLNLDCEEILEKSTEKFIDRFSRIEKKALKKGKSLQSMNLEEMDELWVMVKLEKN